MSAKTALSRESLLPSARGEGARRADEEPSPQRLEHLAGNFAMQRLVQATLRVGAIDDPLEREADEAASCGGCNDVTPCTACADKKVRRSARPASSTALSLSEARMARLGGGAPLDAALRMRMQHQLGHDFSRVRVHTGSLAAETARSIQARAFTTGSDVVFDEGEFRPGTSEGDRLLAHELTHVVQNGGEATTVRRVVKGDIRRISIGPEFARALTDEELAEQMQILRDELKLNAPSSASYQSAEQNIPVLEAEAKRRDPDAVMPGQFVERPAGLPFDGAYRLTPLDLPADVLGEIPEGELVTITGGGADDRPSTLLGGVAGGTWSGLRVNLSTYGFAAAGESAIGIVAFPRYAPERAFSGMSSFLPEHPVLWGHTAVYVRQGGRIVAVRSFAPASFGELFTNPALAQEVRTGARSVAAGIYNEAGLFDIFNVSNARSVEWAAAPDEVAAMLESLPEGQTYGSGQALRSGAQYTAVPGKGCPGTNCGGWARDWIGPQRAAALPPDNNQGHLIRAMKAMKSGDGVAAGGLSTGMQVVKWLGRGFLVAGVVSVPAEIAMAAPEERERTAAGATAGFAGGLAGGAAAGLVCGPGAPACSVVLGLGFGIAGALGARSVAESFYGEDGTAARTGGASPDFDVSQYDATTGVFDHVKKRSSPRVEPLTEADYDVIRQWMDTLPDESGAQR